MSTTIAITCLKELEERGILQLSDIVEFTVNKEIIKYYVWLRFLNTKGNNNKIFEILEIDDKYELAEKAYRYKATEHQWPESKDNDFPALTRLVKELYLIIEEKEIVFTKFTRFEIMEI